LAQLARIRLGVDKTLDIGVITGWNFQALARKLKNNLMSISVRPA
jgi:hypothetical protein